jgi:hypothetical protein
MYRKKIPFFPEMRIFTFCLATLVLVDSRLRGNDGIGMKRNIKSAPLPNDIPKTKFPQLIYGNLVLKKRIFG